jgi:hypothetical protein
VPARWPRGDCVALDFIADGQHLIRAAQAVLLARDQGADDHSELHLDVEEGISDGVALTP